MEDSLEFIYDTEAKALERLKEKMSEEEVNNFLDILYSSDIGNKKIGWGLLFGMEIEQQLKDDITAELFATCDPVKHLQDMFLSYKEVKEQWGNQ